MPLNYLLHRHQVSLMNAEAAESLEARHSHALLAQGYARKIDDLVQGDRESDLPLVPLTGAVRDGRGE